MAFVEIENLWVQYKNFVAVRNLSFSIPRGEVFGFIGPNGAGKATTIKMMTGILKPTAGSLEICGLDIVENPQAAKLKIGYIPNPS